MNKELLENLCLNNCSIRKIAKESSCSPTNIRYWLKKYNLNVKRGACGKHPKNFKLLRKCRCGEIDPLKFYGNKRWICSKCHNKSVVEFERSRAKKIREHLGGKCIICNYSKYQTVLDVHHLQFLQKESPWL